LALVGLGIWFLRSGDIDLGNIGSIGIGSSGDAARVNGVGITEARLNAEMERIELAQPGLFGEGSSVTQVEVRSQILDELINQELLYQKAEEEGIVVTDGEIENELNTIKEQYGDSYQSTLEQFNYTEQELRDQIKFSLMLTGLIESLVPKDSITDAEVKKFYDDNKDELFKEAAAKRVSHILFNIDDVETAQKVLAELQAGSSDFAKLAEEYSQDAGSAANGGDLNWASSDA
jgi:foldase protein PrsA